MGAHVGLMPFNPYTLTPRFCSTDSMQENLGWEAAAGGGYSLKMVPSNIESPSYAISPDAYRYLSLCWFMHNILHLAQNELEWKGCISPRHLLYWGGITIEQLLPDKDMAFQTLSLGIGSRIYNTKTSAFRIQFRDDLFAGTSKTSEIQRLYFKHNLMLAIGYTIWIGAFLR